MELETILIRILQKCEEMDSRLDGMDKTLAVNTAHLEDHIKRTNLLEDLVLQTKSEADVISKDLIKVKTNVEFMRRIPKLIAWALGTSVGVASLIYTLMQIFGGKL